MSAYSIRLSTTLTEMDTFRARPLRQDEVAGFETSFENLKTVCREGRAAEVPVAADSPDLGISGPFALQSCGRVKQWVAKRIS